MFYTPPMLLQRNQDEDEEKTASSSHRLLDFPQMHLSNAEKAIAD